MPDGRVLGVEVADRPKMEPKVIPDIIAEDPRFSVAARFPMLSSEFVFLRAATYIWDGIFSSGSTEVVALLLVKTPGEETYQRRGIVLHAFDSKKVWEGIPTRTISIV
jgi:hypothetical protein